MITASEKMSALEWFFRKPAESNFPQNTSSTELRQLRTAIEKLAVELTAYQATANAEDRVQLGHYFSQMVGTISAREKIEKLQITELIEKVNDVIALLKTPEYANKPITIIESLNATVVALILLAKASQDIDFRTKVISLAKSWSAI